MALDIDHLRAWVGRTETAEDVVTPRLVAEYRATLAPHLAPVPEGDAPLALHWCLTPPIAPQDQLGPDGHPARGGFLPPVPLPRRMWAGGRIETKAPLKVGETVIRASAIEDVTLKEGRSGALCFVTVRHGYAGGDGIVITERHDIVYRDPPPHSAGGQAAPATADAGPAEADLVWEIEATPTLLFRYSAMTFNGHRIHYDEPYVTQVEGYPGLIVHGPLQATLLFNLAAMLGGATPKVFEYRGLSPMFCPTTFRVLGRRQADGSIRCWTEDAGGRTCMEARAAD
ncbi:FAS1-like dehydratase domain-containing protein [Enterovirga aerilata]|uniref:Protein dehydratase n=1 Tax=Enterovirga aerilata TaxID=2730920 RepID=A0A849I7I4_9HYPH|nr:MaoC family dehydratase N-terminal domain-containing protein [Enterovirga sp. DB1703]NNM72040.1 protein dehydratase [Enterovirga sp. DB1703]